MKLTAVLLLVTLAISCCSAAGNDLCPTLINVLTQFLFATEAQYMDTIAPFAPSIEMKQAAAALKECALGLPLQVRQAKGQVLNNVLQKCLERP